MQINLLNNLNHAIKKAGKAVSNPISNLKMKLPLNQDTVNFTGSIKQSFKTSEEAQEYYNNLAQQVNDLLDKGDDAAALEILGCDVTSNNGTDGIIINGNYHPVMIYQVQKKSGAAFDRTDYKKIGIDEERLLKNVIAIKGDSPDYVYEMFCKREEIKAKDVNKALKNKEYEKALNILGFKTSSNSEDITIEGDYTPIRVNLKHKQQTLSGFDINEKELLSHVTRIKGSAIFEKADSVDHYIKVRELPYITKLECSRALFSENKEAAKKLEFMEPYFQQKIRNVKELLKKEDSFEALKSLGIPAKKDENGEITVDGDLEFKLSNYIAGKRFDISYDELGFDYSRLLKDIVRVKGSIVLSEAAAESLNENIIADGSVIASFGALKILDKKFITASDIAKELKLEDMYVYNLIKHGNLKPNLKTNFSAYFGGIAGKNKEFLDNLAKRRDEILTISELEEKYQITHVKIENAVSKGELVPFGVEKAKTMPRLDSYYYMFDTKNETNEKFIKQLAQSLEKKEQIKELQETKPYLAPANIKEACLRNKVTANGINSPMKKYPASVLKVLGYGSKEDLIALAGETMRADFNKIQQYIYDNDFYDLHRKEMMQLLTLARKNNPAIINIIDLQRKLGESREEFLQALSEDKINVITENPLYMTEYSDYCINLFDRKNLEYFKKVKNPEFKEFLSQSYKNYKEYKKHNHEEYEKFINSGALTRKEAREYIDGKAEDRQLAAKLKALQEEQMKKEIAEDRSLRLVIAWALSPKTKAVQGALLDEGIKELLEKYNSLNTIRKILLLSEINLEKASELTDRLGLSEEEKIKILSYYKSCWEISGTKEWSESLKEAKDYLEIYRKQGIDAIDNEEVKEALTRWNKKHNKTSN